MVHTELVLKQDEQTVLIFHCHRLPVSPLIRKRVYPENLCVLICLGKNSVLFNLLLVVNFVSDFF